MKSKILILAVISLLFILSCKKSEKPVEVVSPKKINGIVKAKTGLILRSEPSASGNKITHMPIGTFVVIIDINGPKATIGIETGNWYKISFENNEG